MKLRKPLAILLVLALSLGVAPITGASGAETTLSGSTIAPLADNPEPESDGMESDDSDSVKPDINGKYPDVEVETIHVTVSNIYTIQVNPYRMTISVPGASQTSDDSIVTAPIYIVNHSGVKMDVTASATATTKGGITMESSPPEVYIPDPLDDPDEAALKSSKARLFLYMLMTENFNEANNKPVWSMACDGNGDPVWPKDNEDEAKKLKSNVITQASGAGPLNASIKDNEKAALQIFGETNIPEYGGWHRGHGFDVNIVLSFMPQHEDPGYTVAFDVMDLFYDDGRHLSLPVSIQIGNDSPISFDANHTHEEVTTRENLTFTVKTADERKGQCYIIAYIILIYGDGREVELYSSETQPTPLLIERTCTINAATVTAGETVTVQVILESTTFK